MISIKQAKLYCRRYTEIQNYEDAISDTENKWECHHLAEEFYTMEELKEMGKYYNLEPNELIYLKHKDHLNMPHKGHKNHAESLKGKKLSEKTRKKLLEARRKHTKPIGAERPKKSVICIETNETFESIHEAARAKGLLYSKISLVCNGQRKTTGGYHWKYA